MEHMDLYTEDRQKTGKTMVRETTMPEGMYRLVVHLCIFGNDGRLLIQQRQPFKHGWPNLWDISMGGAAQAGDTSQEAAEREVREELGLSIDLKGTLPSFTVSFGEGFDDFYIVTRDVDLSALRLQPEEVQAVRWAEKEEILSMIRDGTFIPYHETLIDMMFYYRNHRGTHIRPGSSGG